MLQSILAIDISTMVSLQRLAPSVAQLPRRVDGQDGIGYLQYEHRRFQVCCRLVHASHGHLLRVSSQLGQSRVPKMGNYRLHPH